jgi:hypothetical protein
MYEQRGQVESGERCWLACFFPKWGKHLLLYEARKVISDLQISVFLMFPRGDSRQAAVPVVSSRDILTSKHVDSRSTSACSEDIDKKAALRAGI